MSMRPVPGTCSDMVRLSLCSAAQAASGALSLAVSSNISRHSRLQKPSKQIMFEQFRPSSAAKSAARGKIVCVKEQQAPRAASVVLVICVGHARFGVEGSNTEKGESERRGVES